MLRSSAASKPLFASFNEATPLAALRAALRLSFAGFIVGIVEFTTIGSGANVLVRIAGALIPALGGLQLGECALDGLKTPEQIDGAIKR
jgi:hypothetical protein